mgnify:CR=1 FL=1
MTSDERTRERLTLARTMLNSLPRFGQWADTVREFETPFGTIGYRQASILWLLRYELIPPSDMTPTGFAHFYRVQPSVVTRALAKLVDQVAFVGTPDGTPDELVDLYLEGDRLHVALPQQFTRAPRFSPDEMLALLMVLAPLRNAPVPGLAREADALAERLLSLGSSRGWHRYSMAIQAVATDSGRFPCGLIPKRCVAQRERSSAARAIATALALQ